jgi:hypothetical protein
MVIGVKQHGKSSTFTITKLGPPQSSVCLWAIYIKCRILNRREICEYCVHNVPLIWHILQCSYMAITDIKSTVNRELYRVSETIETQNIKAEILLITLVINKYNNSIHFSKFVISTKSLELLKSGT